MWLQNWWMLKAGNCDCQAVGFVEQLLPLNPCIQMSLICPVSRETNSTNHCQHCLDNHNPIIQLPNKFAEASKGCEVDKQSGHTEVGEPDCC